MLPQAFLTPLVLRVRHRKWVFVAGALIQSMSVASMALTAVVGSGLAAGLASRPPWSSFRWVAVWAPFPPRMCRAAPCPRGSGADQRVGDDRVRAGRPHLRTQHPSLRWCGSPGRSACLASGRRCRLLGRGGRHLRRHPRAGRPRGDAESGSWRCPWHLKEEAEASAQNWALLRDDPDFRRFVTVRSLLLVSALSPPLVVTLAVSSGTEGLAGWGASSSPRASRPCSVAGSSDYGPTARARTW